jgi:mono/diheme cytochrome c family protein
MRKSLLAPALLMLAGIAVAIVASFAHSTNAAQNANSSTTQNANSSTTTNRNQNRSITPASEAPKEDFSKNTWELPEDADKTKNPIASSAESIEKGKALFMDTTKGNCIFCHGETGAGNEANLAKLRRKPADLTNKERMTAMTDGEVFWKITKGIRGIMPAGERKIPEAEDRWNVVNYVRTLAKDK